MKFRKANKTGIDPKLEQSIRDLLKVKPWSLSVLADELHVGFATIDNATAKMCDVYEGDDKKLWLIGAAYERS